MRFKLIVLFCLIAGFICLNAVIAEAGGIGRCSQKEVLEYKKNNWTIEDIKELCDSSDETGGGSNPYGSAPPPRKYYATACVTNAGACPMMVQIQVGAACTCTNMYGVFQGIAQ